MVKTIIIGGKPYEMASSVYTSIAYKNKYGKDLFAKIQELNPETRDNTDQNIVSLISDVLDIAYLMITERNRSFMPKDEWLMSIDDVISNPSWIKEVLELALVPFRGRDNFTGF